MLSLLKILLEALDIPPAEVRQAEHFSQDFIDFIKTLENDAKMGFRNGKWYPHKSYEGGLPTIAWGHKIKSKDELRRLISGISDSEAEGILKRDLEEAKEQVHRYMKKLGINIPLNRKQMEMLTEFAFNLGGLEKFPKFTRAVLDQNWNMASKEYKRYAAGKELARRNRLFYDRYFR